MIKERVSVDDWYMADLFNTNHAWNEINKWCYQQFGPRSAVPTPDARWINHLNSTWCFRDESDYLLFMLRWS